MRTKPWRSGQIGLLALLVGLSGTAAVAANVITLGVGSQKVITVPGAKRVSPGDPHIATVKVLGRDQLLVFGHNEGKTSMLVWRSNGTRLSYVIDVQKRNPDQVISEIKHLLGDIEGVSVRRVGDRIYLDGQAYTSADADRIKQVLQLYPDVKSFVKIAPNAKKLVAQTLNAEFQKNGLRNVRANVVGNAIFLEGSVESQEDLKKADLITKAMGETVQNLLVVGIKRMILSEVQFVEIRRNASDRYGIKFPTDITGNATGAISITRSLMPSGPWNMNLTTGATGGSGFAFGFQMNDGYGRLLAQPTLVCASGEKASFLAGGEIPIPLITNNQATVEYKPYGVILEIRPTADRNGNIQTEVQAEVSQIDTSTSVTIGGSISVPGFLTRKVKTNVTVRHGETIVLSGVFSHNEQKAVSKLPGLGNIPIIGELFKNRAFDSNKRELVIFVTPRIVNPDSDKIRTMIEDIKNRYKQARSEVNFDIFD